MAGFQDPQQNPPPLRTIKKPDSQDSNFLFWKHCNTLVISWLYHSISLEIVSSNLLIDNASSVWQELKNWFSQGDIVRISQITSHISSIKQGDSSVIAYFTDLKKISDELFNFCPIPLYSSSLTGCCDTFTTISQYRDHELILSFLQGLNDNYSTVHSQILLVDRLPPLTKIYSMILQQERQLNIRNIGTLFDHTVLAITPVIPLLSPSLVNLNQILNPILENVITLEFALIERKQIIPLSKFKVC
ncbi:uncharacterized protein [Cicer arietinum]|uniref:Uncharacterized protein LOC101505836 n=1 Tax=Cicer arietinum TaxID=3827 RepID=A0A3Q7Y407_CICAR|nr:uncharacterized protein LOC101505836 [Cicer arietinum]